MRMSPEVLEALRTIYGSPVKEDEIILVSDEGADIADHIRYLGRPRTFVGVDPGVDRTGVALIRRDHLGSVTIIDALSHFMTKMEKAPEPPDYLKDIELPTHVQPFRSNSCRYKTILAMVAVMRGAKA